MWFGLTPEPYGLEGAQGGANLDDRFASKWGHLDDRTQVSTSTRMD